MSDEDQGDETDGLDDSFLPTDEGDDGPPTADDPANTDDPPNAPGSTNAAEPGPAPDRAEASGGVDPDAPLGDIADRARRSHDADAGGDVIDAFSEVEVGDDVDVDALWSELEADDLQETVAEPRGSAERDVRVVDKRDYCMGCQYFSAPPDVRCTSERGEILEMVDTDHFEVADCPILRGEEELENLRG